MYVSCIYFKTRLEENREYVGNCLFEVIHVVCRTGDRRSHMT
jgi:hypothetical protein